MASRAIDRCHGYLQDRWPKLKRLVEAQYPGCELRLICTHRTPEEQLELYQIGRTRPGRRVTNIDGFNRTGMHNYNPARAFDVGVFVGGKYITDEGYYQFHEHAQTLGLYWGGDWLHFKDRPHFEIPDGVIR